MNDQLEMVAQGLRDVVRSLTDDCPDFPAINNIQELVVLVLEQAGFDKSQAIVLALDAVSTIPGPGIQIIVHDNENPSNYVLTKSYSTPINNSSLSTCLGSVIKIMGSVEHASWSYTPTNQELGDNPNLFPIADSNLFEGLFNDVQSYLQRVICECINLRQMAPLRKIKRSIRKIVYEKIPRACYSRKKLSFNLIKTAESNIQIFIHRVDRLDDLIYARIGSECESAQVVWLTHHLRRMVWNYPSNIPISQLCSNKSKHKSRSRRARCRKCHQKCSYQKSY